MFWGPGGWGERGGGVVVWTHNTSLAPPLFIEVSVPSQGSERSCICELDVSILPLSSIFLLYFGNVQTELYLYVGDLSGFMTNLFRTIGFRASKDLKFFGLPFF